MAKGLAWEVPAREAPAPGGDEGSRPAMDGWPGTDAQEERPARRGEGPDAPARGYGPEDFPGCESFHLPEHALEGYEGRLEFWDGLTETAWKVSEPTSPYHEGPSRRLARVTERLAGLRGSPIASYGSSDLVRRDAEGHRCWMMQADEVLYLHPERVRLGTEIDVEADPLPDIALEVDHSTDVRLRKLGIYQESGFPEVWVLVPWESSRRTPGLAIHVRGEAGYAEAPQSRAFPGWKAGEIFRALTERDWSADTVRAVERVAHAMGAREGTRPEDDRFTRSLSAKAEARGDARGYRRGSEEGYARGRKEGRDEGYEKGRGEGRDEGRVEGDAKGYERGRGEGREEGRSEMLAANVRAVLAGRGIEAALDSARDRALFGALPAEVLIATALACTGEADFRRRIREQLGPHTGHSS